MKKLLMLLALMCSATILFAQNTGINSVVNEVSSGMFNNAIDSAANVGSEFDDMEGKYLFSGLSNLEETTNNGVLIFNDNGNNEKLLWFGFYMNNGHPWSIFLGFDAEASSGNLESSTITTSNSVSSGVIDGIETIYQWNDVEETKTYTGNKVLNEFRSSIQFLTMLGPVNTGLYFDFYTDDNSPQSENYEFTDIEYYNSADPNEKPEVKEDYTYKKTETSFSKSTTIKIGVPLFIEAGNIAHSANILSSIELNDNSKSVEFSFSDKPHTSGTRSNQEVDEKIDTNSKLDFDIDYTIELPAFLKSHEDNAFSIGAQFGIGIESPTKSERNIFQKFTYAGDEAKGEKSERGEYTSESEFESGVDISFKLNANHSFKYDLGPATFAFKPDLSFNFENNNTPLIVSSTKITKFDENEDGDFSDPLDYTYTEEIKYSNTSATMGNNITETTLTTAFELPMAVKITPKEWPFSINLGSKPLLALTNTIKTTKTKTNSKAETFIFSSPTATPSIKITNAESTDEKTVVDSKMDISAEHNIGLAVPFGDSVCIDVNLGISTSSSNILDFRNMVIQAIISLP